MHWGSHRRGFGVSSRLVPGVFCLRLQNLRVRPSPRGLQFLFWIAGFGLPIPVRNQEQNRETLSLGIFYALPPLIKSSYITPREPLHNPHESHEP